ncbi:unnamed protein product [Oppiella nova]|uniref:Translation elongation factor EF1B beta/delta subunit guanine nucleotide exchange domain-containing protein n=1 Tax=Oppiella nova TaxID=334625 RepID=A0A7R9M1S8_9ACAR|nr:unnamed protein product [Oppiella nova]CAG2169041.1 unnamed protein product [Oppiella nova]
MQALCWSAFRPFIRPLKSLYRSMKKVVDNKPGVVAKSSVVLDVKPWDDETDMKELEANVRKWTDSSKFVPLAYGIQKLQIVIVIEDDKVSVEELTEKLKALEDFVQSVDIAAFNKI